MTPHIDISPLFQNVLQQFHVVGKNGGEYRHVLVTGAYFFCSGSLQ